MIVPRSRLIIIIALVLLPAALLAAYSSRAAAGAWSAAAVVLLLACLDAARGPRRLKGLQVATPAIIRLTAGRSAQVLITLEKTQPPGLTVHLGLALPSAVQSEQRVLKIALLPEQTTCLVKWPCRALERGCHALEACYLEITSAWGLWSVRRRFALSSEIRAYPDLVIGRRQIAGLQQRSEMGLRTLRRMGKGREFEQLREYLPGDSYEDVDWKATARRRYPVTRVFQIEQSQEIYVVLDASRLSTRKPEAISGGTHTADGDAWGQASIFERYLIATLMMGMTAGRAADRFGLLIFSDKIDCFIKAGRGRGHFNACRDALYNRRPSFVSPDFEELFTFIGTHLRKRALLVFLTSLDDPVLAENFVQAMPAAVKKHILVVNMLRPVGAHPLFSEDNVQQVDDIYAHLVGHMLWNSLAELRPTLRRQGAAFHLLDNEALCAELVQQYVDIKQRQVI